MVGGQTVDGQIDFLTRKNNKGVYEDSNYSIFMRSIIGINVNDYSDNNKLVEYLTYLFASKFERCAECVKGESTETIRKRKGDALGFYNDMNDKNSYLYYDK